MASAAAAMRTNGARMNQVVAALNAAGIRGREVRTSNLTLSPQYAYEQGKPARLTGYRASNQLSVTVNELTRLGAVLDGALGAGANDIGQIEYGLVNPLPAENEARLAAIKALEDKAALYAQASGYRIARLVSLGEGAGYELPRFIGGAAAKASPVEAGQTKVRIEVSGVFELAR